MCLYIRPNYAVLAYGNMKPNKDQILQHGTLVINAHTQIWESGNEGTGRMK